eukprot:3167667-Prymnesium_polylepis.1
MDCCRLIHRCLRPSRLLLLVLACCVLILFFQSRLALTIRHEDFVTLRDNGVSTLDNLASRITAKHASACSALERDQPSVARQPPPTAGSRTRVMRLLRSQYGPTQPTLRQLLSEDATHGVPSAGGFERRSVT